MGPMVFEVCVRWRTYAFKILLSLFSAPKIISVSKELLAGVREKCWSYGGGRSNRIFLCGFPPNLNCLRTHFEKWNGIFFFNKIWSPLKTTNNKSNGNIARSSALKLPKMTFMFISENIQATKSSQISSFQHFEWNIFDQICCEIID